MLKPARSIHRMKETASRQFTDREEPKKSFSKALSSLQADQYKVLVFYGVGGIGKSRLLKELFSLTTDETIVKVTIDFREEKHREPSDALIWMRQQLNKQYKVEFTTFDMAYSVYWTKINPHLSLKSERKGIPFLEEGSFVSELIAQLENIPVVQWIPKTVKLLEGFSQYKEILQWWNGIGKEILSNLKDMHPKDIEDMLLVYWTTDLKNWLKTHNQKVIFFFDTYEALWEKDRTTGAFMEKDEWIRDFMLQFDNELVLNVLFGREKIQWENLDPEWGSYIEQHLIGELSDRDCISFLSSCGITDEEIQKTIIKGSEGLPYYLDLMVDTYQIIQRKRAPKIADFSKTPNQVLDRFLRYLDRSEKETLKILSIPRFWSEDLFIKLVSKFKTFYPVTAFNELCQFSFIHNIDQSENWAMHNLMKIGLNEQVMNFAPSLFDDVHLFLFKYYTDKLNDSNENNKSSSFVEGLYHGHFILTENELVEWISTYSTVLFNHGNWQTLINAFENIIEHKTNEKLQALAHQKLGELYTLKGQDMLAETHCLSAIELYEKEKIANGVNPKLSKKIALVQKSLGNLYRSTNQYRESIKAFNCALQELEDFNETDVEAIEERTYITTRLGKIFKLQSEYDLAKQYYEKALSECTKVITIGSPTASIYAILGQVNEKLGELEIDEIKSERNEKALGYLNAAIEAYDLALIKQETLDFIPVLAHKGLAYKRLAEYYSKEKDPAKRLAYFQKAIAIYNEVLLLAPDYVDGYEMRGHVSVDLLDLYIVLGEYEKGLESFQLALISFEKVLELSEKQGSSRNRIGSAYRTLGNLYRKQKNYSLAIEAYETAVQKSDQLFLYSPEYIYGYNSRGKTFKAMGDCYLEMEYYTNVKHSYQEAISCFDHSLSRTPNSKTAIFYKEELSKLLEQF